MNLAARDIRHRLGRFVLTCLGLGLLLGVVISMVGIYRGLVADALLLVRAPLADLWIVEGGSQGPFAESSRIPRDTRNSVARLHGVTEAGMVTYQTTQITVQDQPLRVMIVGYEPGRLGGPHNVVEGRTIQRSHFELIADQRSGLQLGQRVRIADDWYQVVGRTRGMVDSAGNPVLHMALLDAQDVQFKQDPATARNLAQRGEKTTSTQVNAVLARLADSVDAEQIAQSISRWKHLSALTQQQQENLQISAVVDKARKQIGMFTMLLLLVSTVIISLIIYTMTMDKVRDIATLKLIGAPDRVILGLIVQQSLLLGSISFATGYGLVRMGADHFPRRVVIEHGDVTMLGLAVLVACLLASLAGVRYALRIDPAQALGG